MYINTLILNFPKKLLYTFDVEITNYTYHLHLLNIIKNYFNVYK